MQTPTEVYSWFFAALEDFFNAYPDINKGAIAIEIGISEPYLSQIRHKVRRAPFKTQIATAAALGYGYPEFLAHGREIVGDESFSAKPVFLDMNRKIIEIEDKFYTAEQLGEMAADVIESDIDPTNLLAIKVYILYQLLQAATNKKQLKKNAKQSNIV